MAEEQELFNPLDSLGPEFGKINRPVLDSTGLSPFEGKSIRPEKINFPEVYYPAFPQSRQNLPNTSIKENVVGTKPNQPGPGKKVSAQEFGDALGEYFQAVHQADQDKNVYSRIYSYDAGPSGNSFYKRYAAYGQKTFDKVGFHPLKNNEANFNAATTWWDDANRMLTHSFVPLLKNGFYSGPKSMIKMLQGDFTSADLEDARMYEEAAAIGQSTKGGFGSLFNNTLMNFGYTAGIIGEAIVEEVAGAVLAPVTGGTSFAFTTANNVNKVSKAFKGFGLITDGAKAVRQSLKAFSNLPEARKFWEASQGALTSKIGRVVNPFENTLDAVTGLSKMDNLTNLAKISKTAGGFYRDVRNLNMALSEARLEAGMVENKVFDTLYDKHYEATGQAPTDKDEYEFRKQAKEASTSTLYLNTGLIYLSNKITFDSITSPRGGIRNFLKSKTDDILAVDSGKFGSLGKVVYDKTKKTFEFQKNNLKNLAKSWYKDPLYKSGLKTVSYFKANVSEGLQENLQEVIAGANERYYIDTFNSDARSSYEYSKAAIKDGLARQRGDYFREELGKQFSAQGLETFASGFLMGTFAAPLNSAIPFLSTQYNRIFDKEAYNKWKKSKAQIAFGLVNQLNDVNISEFLSDRVYNLGAQDIAAQIKRTGTKKEALDAENQAFVDSVSLMMNTGTIEQFKDKLGSYKEMTDEEFMDSMSISQDDVPKFRQRIDQSIEKLDKVKGKYESYANKFPNPVDPSTLDEKDPEFYNKALLYHSWNKAVTNAVFFSETFDDVKQRMSEIKNKYTQNKGFTTINSTDAAAIFKPDALINQVGLFETELEAEKANPKPNAKRIKALEDKIASLNEFSQAYEGFNRFFSRGQYAGEIIAELKKELGTDPTQAQIIERMDQKLGSIENEELALPYVEALRNSHHKYLKTLGLEQEEIMFDEDLDAGFEQLLDFYKLNDEYKQSAKYVEALNNPENFIDLVDRNSAWMEKLYHNREEYYTKMVYDQISKVEANSLLNALADDGLFISTEDFENYVNNGTPPSEIFNAPLNRVFKRGTEEYNQVYREYFVKMAELKETVAPKKSEFVNKEYQSKVDKLDADMKAEIDALPKDPETGEPDPKAVEKITNKYNKQKERVEQQFKKDKTATPDEEQEDYTFNFEGETLSTKGKSIKDLRVYQDLINDRIKVLQAAKDEAADPEEKKRLTEQIKQFNKDSANIEKIIDAMTLKGYTPEQRKAIKAIQNLIKQQEGVEESYVLTEDDPTTGLKKGDTAYRIKGLIHRRVTNAIRDIESKDYTYQDADTIESAYNKTIGKDGLNKTSAINFVAKLRAEKLDGFNGPLYDELEEYVANLEGKSKAQIDQEQYIYKLEQNLIKLDEKIATADKDDNTKRSNLLRKQKDDLLVELENTTNQVIEDEEISTPDTTLDLIQKFAAERSYEDSRVVGNYVDDAKDYFEKGIKPEFDEKIITREAYDSLFGENGYLTELKRKVDDRELYIVGRGLVVYDSDITREDGTKDRIAGEIDLVMADRKGNVFIVDLKTGSKSKWNSFNKVNRLPADKYYSKRENYTLQQGAYARMLENMTGYKAKVALLPVERTSDKETNQILTAGKPTSESIYKQLIFPKDENGNYVITERGEVDFDVDDTETKSAMFIPLYPDAYKKQLDKILPLKIKSDFPRVSLRPGEFEEGMDADEEFGAPFDAPVEPSEQTSVKPEVNVTTRDVYDGIINKYSATEKATQDRIESLKASLVPLSSNVSFTNIDLADNSPFIVDQLEKDTDFAERFSFHERLKENTSAPSFAQEEAVKVLNDSGILTTKEVVDTQKKYPTMAAYSELIHEAVKRIQFLKSQSTDNAEIKALTDYQRQIFTLMAENKFLNETKEFMSTASNIEGAYRKGNVRTAIRLTNDQINNLSQQASYKSVRPEQKKRLELKITDLRALRDTIIADEGLENALDDLKTVADLTKEITTAMDLEKARKQLVNAIKNDLIITTENINYLNNLIKQREEQLANNEMPVMDETNIREGDIYIAKTNIFTSEKQKNPYIKLGGKVRVVSYDAATNTVTLVKDGGKKPKSYQVGLDEFNEQYMLEDVLNAAPSAPKYNPSKDEKDLVKYSGEVLGDFLKDTEATAKAKADAEKQSMEDIDNELLDNLTCE